jgi:hypothetical protein
VQACATKLANFRDFYSITTDMALIRALSTAVFIIFFLFTKYSRAGDAQTPLASSSPVERLEPLALDFLNTEHFTTLSHTTFPHYSIRVKSTKFCDPSVRQAGLLQASF